MGARDEGIHGATAAEAEGITALMMPIKWSRPGGTWCGSGLVGGAKVVWWGVQRTSSWSVATRVGRQ
jgi:hypothetical protein